MSLLLLCTRSERRSAFGSTKSVFNVQTYVGLNWGGSFLNNGNGRFWHSDRDSIGGDGHRDSAVSA